MDPRRRLFGSPIWPRGRSVVIPAFHLSPPVARKVEIALPPFLLATRIVYLGMADPRTYGADGQGGRSANRSEMSKNVPKISYQMGLDGNVA